MIKKVLIAVDELCPDHTLVKKGVELAEQLDAEIGLIDVARLSIGYIDAGIYPGDMEELNRMRAEKTIEGIKEEFPQYSFVDFEPVGDPVSEIQHIIESWKPDMLVLGHHKHSLLQRLSENSRERKLINHISIPVLVIPCG